MILPKCFGFSINTSMCTIVQTNTVQFPRISVSKRHILFKFTLRIMRHAEINQLPHCAQVAPYGDTDLAHQLLNQSIVAWRHQAIDWGNINFSSACPVIFIWEQYQRKIWRYKTPDYTLETKSSYHIYNSFWAKFWKYCFECVKIYQFIHFNV